MYDGFTFINDRSLKFINLSIICGGISGE